MAVRTKDEILNSLKEMFGNDNSDGTLSLLEDVSDTYDDMSSQIEKSGEWKNKYERNDKEWREKYKERFFSKPADNDDALLDPPTGANTESNTEPKKPMTFDDLFKIE